MPRGTERKSLPAPVTFLGLLATIESVQTILAKTLALADEALRHEADLAEFGPDYKGPDAKERDEIMRESSR